MDALILEGLLIDLFSKFRNEKKIVYYKLDYKDYGNLLISFLSSENGVMTNDSRESAILESWEK